MIDLMLQRHREQSFGFDLYGFFIFIDGDDFHLGGAAHFGSVVDHAETAFFPNDLAFGTSNHRIDELIDLFARVLMVDVQHDNSLRNAHLRRGEADAGAAYMVSSKSLTR